MKPFWRGVAALFAAAALTAMAEQPLRDWSGKPTPPLALDDLAGKPVDLARLRGRVVLVNFWATGCFPCRAEMPMLQAMHARHEGRGFTMVGLSVDREGPEVVGRFVRERSITYPIAIVGREIEHAFGGVRGYPTSFLIDRQGVIRHAVIGPLAPATLELAVRRLLIE
jgi:thiol-disulfide isomerase/thioredoxin